MTEFWVSQAKKYCDFCKCWIADNAPNVSFHDNGRKHRENVKRKLSEMTKQSQKEHTAQLKVEDEIKKMEEAAMKAYLKDIAESGDLTSKVIQEKLTEKQKAKEADVPPDKLDEDVEEETSEEETAPTSEEKKWYEAQSDEGYTYYWHVETGESRWEPPEEGYMSVAEQKEEEKKQQVQEKKQQEKEAREARRKAAEEERRRKEQAEEDRARQEREKMKSRRKVEEKVEETAQSPQDEAPVLVGPAPRVDPYGGWTVIDNRQQAPIDLQLPEQQYVAVKLPSTDTTEDVAQTRFNEKTISTLIDDDNSGDTVVSFKKRKLGSSTKKNVRQRLDDDN